jgi:hypothetical protein
MTVKAKLQVLLKADDVEVAHSEDAGLWQSVLLAITANRPLSDTDHARQRSAQEVGGSGGEGGPSSSGPLMKMAGALGIDAQLLTGACNPTVDAPFITLDAHRYEAMRRSLPARGTKSISNIQLAGTLLALWFYYAGLGNVSQAQAQAVLGPLGVRDPNPGRGIANAEWLQTRAGGQFALNPAEISTATTIVRSFCKKEWAAFLGTSE